LHSGFKSGALVLRSSTSLGTSDGVMELELNGDMRKMGLWTGLCFFANGCHIPRQ